MKNITINTSIMDIIENGTLTSTVNTAANIITLVNIATLAFVAVVSFIANEFPICICAFIGIFGSLLTWYAIKFLIIITEAARIYILKNYDAE